MGEMPPETPLVRTAAVSSEQWNAFKSALATESEEGFRAYVRDLMDARFIGASEATLRAEFTDTALILVADDQTFAAPDYPVLCIDPEGQTPSFRASVDVLWIVENNVSIGNLLFEELAEDQVVDGRLVVE